LTLPARPADHGGNLEALARARKLQPLDTDVYLDWLTMMSISPESASRLNTDDDLTFDL
jgi:hypothetical protein